MSQLQNECIALYKETDPERDIDVKQRVQQMIQSADMVDKIQTLTGFENPNE